MTAEVQRSEYVQAFERGLAVISSFEGTPQTLSEVAQKLGMSPAAARRYLVTLTELGYLAHDGSRFSAQAKLLELAQPYFSSHDGLQLAQLALQQLTKSVHETSSLTQLDGTEVINVLSVQTTQELAIQVVPGLRLPAYCTAMGRAMLSLMTDEEVTETLAAADLVRHTVKTIVDRDALLEQIRTARRDGYALAEEEYSPGIRTMSRAFRFPQGQLAALSVPTPTARESREAYIARVADPLRNAVERLA
ncbi:IclR family transcriptional regulator domain-containing protein [Specibacter cremeus]|uniref:IclR family transcriptional regulator domain-containing protein n=1 Tax=Specibacter cremeus TaxID=1629051 RepID=UPI000F7827EC|nr:IclR family transcriptional regulator C-terminal domain-containing protein [Specibacter cremeus]